MYPSHFTVLIPSVFCEHTDGRDGDCNCYTETAQTGGMERRSFVRLVPASVSAAFLPGCLGGGEPKDEGGGDENASGRDEEPTEQNTVSLAETDFEVVRTGGGTRIDSVSVDFEENLPGFSGEDVAAVIVEGALAGRNSCYTAELESAEYDGEEDSFRVGVRSVEDREEDEVCAQVITEIKYRLTASFEGGLPERATVRHDGETVAEAVRNV
jgi:hypothetical protein